MLHRTLISIILCLFPLLGNGQSLLPKDVQEECINSLASYLTTDSTRVRDLSSDYKQAGLTFDSIAYYKNVEKVRLFAKEAIELCKLDKPLKALSLLDKNKECFYKHPANSIYNENDFHWTLICLYAIKYNGKTLWRKQIKLWEHTYEHILDAELVRLEYHPLHYDVLLALISLYYELGDLPSAIKRTTQMCEYLADCEGTDSVAYKAVAQQLSKLYKEAGYINKSDSCINH